MQALPLILGSVRKEDAAYLDACRAKRNTVEYDYAGGATDGEANELIEFVKELRAEVESWLQKNRPDLV